MKVEIKDTGCVFASVLSATRNCPLQPTLVRMPRKYYKDLGARSESSSSIFSIPVECHETKFELEYHNVLHIVAQLQVDLVIDPTEYFIVEGSYLKTQISLDAFVPGFDPDTLVKVSHFVHTQPVLVLTDGNCYKINTVRVFEDRERCMLKYEMEFEREYILNTKYLPSLERAMAQDPDELVVMYPDLVKAWAKEATEPSYVDIKKISSKVKGRIPKL
jgi:hypothetical protein